MSILGRKISVKAVAALVVAMVVGALLPVMTQRARARDHARGEGHGVLSRRRLRASEPGDRGQGGGERADRVAQRGARHDARLRGAGRRRRDGPARLERTGRGHVRGAGDAGHLRIRVHAAPAHDERHAEGRVDASRDLATPDGKRRYVRRLFATIADRYDFITRFLSYGQDRRWKRRLVRLAAITPADRVLDLACGTGDILFSAAAAREERGGTRRDASHAAAREEAPQRAAAPLANRRVVHRTITVTCALPFGAGAVRRRDDRLRVEERARSRGGDCRDPSRPRSRRTPARRSISIVRTIHRCGRVSGVPDGRWLGARLRRCIGDPDTYRYIPESIRNYPGAHGVARLLEQHGFSDVRVIPVLGGLMAIHVARKATSSLKPEATEQSDLRSGGSCELGSFSVPATARGLSSQKSSTSVLGDLVRRRALPDADARPHRPRAARLADAGRRPPGDRRRCRARTRRSRRDRGPTPGAGRRRE